MRPGHYSLTICDRQFTVDVGFGPPDGDGVGHVDFERGTVYINKDADYPLGVLHHELWEAVAVLLGYRYQDYDGNFLFVMTHVQMDHVIDHVSHALRYMKRLSEKP